MKSILVVGATGRQGNAAIRTMCGSPCRDDYTIYAVTDDPSSTAARRLAQMPNVNVIKGDSASPQAVFEAAGKGIWGVFFAGMTEGRPCGPQTEEGREKPLVDAAVAHGVSHFVYTSVERGGDVRTQKIHAHKPHFNRKHPVEEYLEQAAASSDMTYTFLRSEVLLDCLTDDFRGKTFTTAWRMSLGDKKPLSVVAADDIGWFAADALMHRKDPTYRNTTMVLAGDVLTFRQMSEIFEARTGEPVPTTCSFLARLALRLNGDLAKMLKRTETDGFHVNIGHLRQIHPGLKDFRQWLNRQSDWRYHPEPGKQVEPDASLVWLEALRYLPMYHP